MANLLPTHNQGGKEPKPQGGRLGIVLGVLGGLVLLALVGVAIAHALGVFGGAPPNRATPTPTPTVAATPTVDQTKAVIQVGTRFGNDVLQDNGADAYTLLTPQAQAQATPQQLTTTLRPPPNVVYSSWGLGPVNIWTFNGVHALVVGDLIVVKLPDPTGTRVHTEFHLDQQPDGTWRVASYSSPYFYSGSQGD